MAMIHSNRLAGWPVWGSGNDEQVGSVGFLLVILTSFHDGPCVSTEEGCPIISPRKHKPVHIKMILGESQHFKSK